MNSLINLKTFLWAIGVIQPARPQEVHEFLMKTVSAESELFSDNEMELAINESLDKGYVENVSKKNDLYCLTIVGGDFLGNKLRVLRDKNRLFLLKSIRSANFYYKDSFERNMDGASPSESLRSSIKVSPRPENFLSSGPHPQRQKVFWPRVYEQLLIGSNSGESLHPINLNFYSKNNLPDILDKTSAIKALSFLIGISPYLLVNFSRETDRYYRTFSIPKKSGGEARVISSPRAFIKTTQYWIYDYFLFRLRLHDCCFSFRKKVSIKHNATIHLNRKFIMCLDIEAFFDNITRERVVLCLTENGINKYLAFVIADIVTLNDSLPQGAPTSPIISNSYLYSLDKEMFDYCSKKNISYSRYADDLAFGADNYDDFKLIVAKVEQNLRKLGLNLNSKKTRIISANNCQVITGIAINNGVIRPTRKYRKEIRALFYKAKLEENVELLPKLHGHLNYLNSFDSGDTEFNLNSYQSVIDLLNLKKKLKFFFD